MRSIRSRSTGTGTGTESCVTGVSSVCVSEASSMAKVFSTRAREETGTFANGQTPAHPVPNRAPQIVVIDGSHTAPRRYHGRPATSQSNCLGVRLS